MHILIDKSGPGSAAASFLVLKFRVPDVSLICSGQLQKSQVTQAKPTTPLISEINLGRPSQITFMCPLLKKEPHGALRAYLLSCLFSPLCALLMTEHLT